MKEKNDILEQLIRDNRSLFDEDAPEGHFERFQQKLNKEPIPIRKNRKKLFLQIAAAVAFVLLLGNQVRMYLQMPADKQESYSLASVSSEYGEAEFYYTSAIDQGMEQWNKLMDDGMISLEEQQMMQQEIDEFETTYQKLQQELKANPGDERVVNAMLELYQTRLSIIHLIIEKLENIKKQNHDESEI